ncbi:MAG: SWIM zinc finger family protein [Candidatus Nanopelagicus sp.]
MQVPTKNSKVRVKVNYSQGPRMFPPQPDHHVFEGTVLPSHKWLTDRQFCMSGDETMKVRVIDMSLVQDIELLSGDFQTVDTGMQTFEVEGSKGKKYIVTKDNKGWDCTCPGFQFRKSCKHVTELSK